MSRPARGDPPPAPQSPAGSQVWKSSQRRSGTSPATRDADDARAGARRVPLSPAADPSAARLREAVPAWTERAVQCALWPWILEQLTGEGRTPPQHRVRRAPILGATSEHTDRAVRAA